MQDFSKFQDLDFGTKPSTVSLEVIEVEIHSELMIQDFAQAYLGELNRRNPKRLEAVNLTVKELDTYFQHLIAFRLQSLSPEGCKEWRQAKQLYIPTWIEFTLSRIGVFVDQTKGLKFIPKGNVSYNIDEMLTTSSKLSAFLPDGLGLQRDAFPRSSEGDPDLMTFAIIDGMVKSLERQSHPLLGYVAAFLGFKVREEQAFRILYRINYDDVEFIRTMLMYERRLF